MNENRNDNAIKFFTTSHKTQTNNNMKVILENILLRLKETSTWRGLIVVASVIGWSISPADQEIIISAGVGLIATLEIIRREQKKVDE